MIDANRHRPPILIMPRLLLRELRPGDAAAVAAGAGDRRVARFLIDVPSPYPVALARRWIAGRVAWWELGRGITFAIARRYCVHRHRVVEEGPWYDFKSCWLNELYTRTVPSHAVEMTAAYLDRGVENLLARLGLSATLAQKQTLATLMHLCGAGAASEYARRGFALAPGQSCGSHDARGYVARVASMQRRFKALASA